MRELVLVSFFLAGSLCAEIVWEEDVIERTVRGGEEYLEVEFSGKNTSAKPVEIEQIISSCSCLKADVSSRTVPGGAEVKLKARFTIEDRSGFQRKTIELRTFPPTAHRQALTLRTTILEDVYFDRQSLYWSPDRPAVPQTLRIKVVRKEPLFLTKVDVGNRKLSATVEEVEPGRIYRAVVTPSDVRELFESELRFLFRDPGGEDFTVVIPAAVR